MDCCVLCADPLDHNERRLVPEKDGRPSPCEQCLDHLQAWVRFQDRSRHAHHQFCAFLGVPESLGLIPPPRDPETVLNSGGVQDSGATAGATSKTSLLNRELRVQLTRLDPNLLGGNSIKISSLMEENNTKSSNIECDICHKKFPSKSCLRKHIDIEHLHHCKICGETFTTLNEFKNHEKNHQTPRENENIKILIQNYKCNTCNMHFEQKIQLIKHLTKHEDKKSNSCHICKKVFNYPVDLRAHLRIHAGEKSFKCDLCAHTFTRKSILVRHLDTHKNTTPFACDKCTKSFTQKSNLQRHYLQCHEKEKSFSCTICTDKYFNTKRQLRAHLKLLHTRPHSCSICNRTFKYKSHLNNHLTVHLNEGPDSNDELKEEIKRQISNNDGVERIEKLLRCPQCNKVFKHASRLKCHLILHSEVKPYSCEMCDKTFKRKEGLVEHTEMTHGDSARDFKCTICYKTFRHPSYLKKHQIVHSNERPYKCSHCSHTFKLKRILYRHMFRKHNL